MNVTMWDHDVCLKAVCCLPAVPVGQICVGEVSGPAVPWPWGEGQLMAVEHLMSRGHLPCLCGCGESLSHVWPCCEANKSCGLYSSTWTSSERQPWYKVIWLSALLGPRLVPRQAVHPWVGVSFESCFLLHFVQLMLPGSARRVCGVHCQLHLIITPLLPGLSLAPQCLWCFPSSCQSSLRHFWSVRCHLCGTERKLGQVSRLGSGMWCDCAAGPYCSSLAVIMCTFGNDVRTSARRWH